MWETCWDDRAGLIASSGMHHPRYRGNQQPMNEVRSDDEARWEAVMRRDRACDGQFVTGVLSTGIYCRPSCAARHPRRENVRFFAAPDEAERAGLRPCKRCRPEAVSRDEQAVRRALDILSDAEEAVSLDQLAAATGYSAHHFQRMFKRAVGLSPAAYARAIRADRASNALSSGASVTEAIHQAGYGAPSRFYEGNRERLGMTPSVWRGGGKGATIRWAQVETTLGTMLVAATDKGVCRLSFGEGVEELAARFPQAELSAGGADFTALVSQVVAAVESPGDARDIPLDVQGTAFQEAVWQELRKIPPGETRSYGQIAAAIGKPGAVRAAGSANGANHVAVLIPCHRVVRSDGSMGGYAYGEAIKRELLRREDPLQGSDST